MASCFVKIGGAVLEILMRNIFLKMVPPAKTAAFWILLKSDHKLPNLG
jgi:hypothetical protein